MKKCLLNKTLAIPLDEIQINDKIQFIVDLVEIIDREVKRLKQIRIPIIKVHWNLRRGHEFTWEQEDQMQKKYPHLFANSAPIVENRVLVTKPYNKTLYELLISRSSNLDFVRPFGCHVTILNTLDHLGKFEGKADKGFLVGYSVNNKAFRVFNTRTRKVKENLHIEFLENKSNVVGCIDINVNAWQAGQEKAYDHEYILLPFMPSNSPLSSSTQSSDDKDTDEVPRKGDEGVSKGSRIDDQERTDSRTQDVNTVGPSINTANTNINTDSLNINTVGSNDLSMPSLEEISIFDDVYNDREVGAEADTNNLELSTVVSPIPTTRVHKDHPKEQIIRDLNLVTQTRRMINFFEENDMVKQKDDGIFISQDKYVVDILKKFDFTTVKTPSTLTEPNKALIKDVEAEDVDVHLYRSMIG
nr:putative reverse transcriptase domain-containing protein [Tanacetum cinerariifolium]